MNKLLTASVLATAMALSVPASSQAADLAARTYKAAPVLEAAYNWSGFYLGLNAGYGWAGVDHADVVPGGQAWTFGPGGLANGSQTINPAGAVYGGQIGYNWQFSNWVIGLEGQFNGASIRRTDIAVFAANETLEARVNSFATVTGRLGYAVNNWLPYVKGGYAGASLKTINADNGGNSLTMSNWRSGFVIGAGVEYGLTPNWTLGVEYNYMDFGRVASTANDVLGVPPIANAGTETFTDRLRISTVTGRINYRFGGPVVAKY